MRKKYERKSGVYILENVMTGNFYIGLSKNLAKRKGRHFYVLRNGMKGNIRISDDCKKYGVESFDFKVLEYCDECDLLEKEQYYFELMMPQYNVWKSVYNAKGRTYTNEQLEYFKNTAHGPKNLENHSNVLKEAWKRRKEKYTPAELHEKMSKARTGIKHSEETKMNYSLQRKGKTKSESMKNKLRESRLGTKLINGKFVKLPTEVF
jgi:group I intron endonuclease